MKLLSPQQTKSLKHLLLPDSPGPMTGLHVINTQQGSCHVDQWTGPQIILFHTGGNYSLIGNPEHLNPADLEGLISGFVTTTDDFIPALKAVFPELKYWDRVIFEWAGNKEVDQPDKAIVRRLTNGDAYHLWGLSPYSSWIHHTWGGPDNLARSGYAWGAFFEDKLVSVSCTFFLGNKFEDIGVITESGYQRRGLSQACVSGLCRDILNRGRKPSWTTAPDNIGSIKVAQNTGFRFLKEDRLVAIGVEIP